jgi:hypothetical protein
MPANQQQLLLLDQAIQAHVAAVWPAPSSDRGPTLQLVSRRLAAHNRGFFKRMEFMAHSWECDPGYKEVVVGPRPRCSCGGCIEGVLSRRMAEKLRRVADR